MAGLSACDVADLFLSWANKDGDLITNLKIQKLLYYAQAWYLVYFKRPLFVEQIEAWELGPVVRKAYNKFKKFSCSPIRYEGDGKEARPFTKQQLEYLKVCYDTFIRISARDLVNMTHNEDPWREAFKCPDSKVISNDLMTKYYSKLLKKK